MKDVITSKQHQIALDNLQVEIWESIKNHIGRLAGFRKYRLPEPRIFVTESGELCLIVELDGRGAYGRDDTMHIQFQTTNRIDKLIQILSWIED